MLGLSSYEEPNGAGQTSSNNVAVEQEYRAATQAYKREYDHWA